MLVSSTSGARSPRLNKGVELNGISDTSLEVASSLPPCMEKLLCKVLRMFTLDSLTRVGVASRPAGEKLEYLSKLEGWLVLVRVALHEDLSGSSVHSADRYCKIDRKLVCSVVAVSGWSV